MRYLEAENPYIICRFTTGDTVTIDIYDLADDSKDVDGVSMTEIGSTGYFKYQFNPSISTLMEYLYIADNGTEEHAGKIILGGYPDGIKDKTDTIDWTDVTFLKDIEGGRWIRDGTEIKFYKSDNVTLVATFNLKKADGNAAGESDDVYERTRA